MDPPLSADNTLIMKSSFFLNGVSRLNSLRVGIRDQCSVVRLRDPVAITLRLFKMCMLFKQM